MGEEEKILEVMAEAIRRELERCGVIVANVDPARAALTALQADGWVVVRKSHGISHERESFKSEQYVAREDASTAGAL